MSAIRREQGKVAATSRAATERLAANAEEALYDAFLAGRYEHIRDLNFAEPTAPKAGTGNGERGTEAPQTGAKPSAEEKADEELVHERSGVFNAALGTLKSLAETAGKIKSNFYKAVNEHFGADHSFDFGKPSGMLRGHLPDNPIQLKLQTLLRKRSEGYKNDHPFDFDEIADIVEQIHRPALLLKNEGDLPGVRAFFQVTSGRVFVVAIKPDGEINDISTLFPKDLGRLVKTIQMLKGRTGDVLGIDVEKAVRMLESRSNTASAQDPNDLSDAISVLKNLSPVKAMAKAGSILAPKDSTSQAENPALPSTERIVSNPGGGGKGEASQRVVRWEAQTPRGNKYVGGYYKVFKLSDLVHSNDPRYKAHAALQGRNRVDNKLEESDRDRIKAEFNGRRYLDNEVTSDGAPIVVMLPDAEGVTRPFVLSGNGRVLVLNDLAESHLYDRYRNPLKEWAAKNGVEMDVADGDNPVLVRVLDDLKGSNLLEVSRLSNVRTSTPPTETELARTDAEYLRSLDLARLYHANADGSPDMTPGVNDEFFRKFSQGPDAETTFDEKNNVGESAQRRIMRAFLHLAVGDSPRGLAAAEKLITMSGTYGIDRQKGALQMMAPGVARTEGNPDYAIGPDVARAIADFMDFTEMRRAGKVGKLDDYIAQGDMFDQPSEIAADILRTLAEGRGTARDMAERVNAYAEIAAHSDADGALGGAANARSRADVWREAKGLAEQRIAERTPKTRFSIRSEADGNKDEEKKKPTDHRPLSKSEQTPPVQFSGGATSITLTRERADPVKKFGDSISQDGVKSPADFLTGLVHGCTEKFMQNAHCGA